MSILTDAIQDEAQAATNNYGGPDPATEPQPSEDPESSGGFTFPDFSFLRTPTGAGSIEDYIEHPLNSEKSRGMAQVLRGFTGIAGDLKLAIIDIALGSLTIAKEKKG